MFGRLVSSAVSRAHRSLQIGVDAELVYNAEFRTTRIVIPTAQLDQTNRAGNQASSGGDPVPLYLRKTSTLLLRSRTQLASSTASIVMTHNWLMLRCTRYLDTGRDGAVLINLRLTVEVRTPLVCPLRYDRPACATSTVAGWLYEYGSAEKSKSCGHTGN